MRLCFKCCVEFNDHTAALLLSDSGLSNFRGFKDFKINQLLFLFSGGRVENSLYNLSSIDSTPSLCTLSNPTCATTAELPNKTGPLLTAKKQMI